MLAVAIENAEWTAPTIAGANGSTTPRTSAGNDAMNAAPEAPTPVSACTPPTPASTPPTCGGTPADANAAGSSRVIDVAKTVPVIASPTVPPTCWKNVTLLLAAPIWVTGTLLWTMSGKAAKIGPTPQPGQANSGSIVSLDIAGSAALAKTKIEYLGVRYTDYLSLLKLDGEWKIIAKVYSTVE